MSRLERRRFDPRAFVSTALAVSVAGLPVTGLANHLLQAEPPISLARHAWMAAHGSLGVVFIACAAWHVILNHRPLLRQLGVVSARVRACPGREAALALALVGLMTIVAVGHAFLAG